MFWSSPLSLSPSFSLSVSSLFRVDRVPRGSLARRRRYGDPNSNELYTTKVQSAPRHRKGFLAGSLVGGEAFRFRNSSSVEADLTNWATGIGGWQHRQRAAAVRLESVEIQSVMRGGGLDWQ